VERQVAFKACRFSPDTLNYLSFARSLGRAMGKSSSSFYTPNQTRDFLTTDDAAACGFFFVCSVRLVATFSGVVARSGSHGEVVALGGSF